MKQIGAIAVLLTSLLSAVSAAEPSGDPQKVDGPSDFTIAVCDATFRLKLLRHLNTGDVEGAKDMLTGFLPADVHPIPLMLESGELSKKERAEGMAWCRHLLRHLDEHPQDLDPKRWPNRDGLNSLWRLFQGQPEATTIKSIAERTGIELKHSKVEEKGESQSNPLQDSDVPPHPER